MKIKSTFLLIVFFTVSIKVFSQTVIVNDDAAYTTGETSSVPDIKSTAKGTATANTGAPLKFTLGGILHADGNLTLLSTISQTALIDDSGTGTSFPTLYSYDEDLASSGYVSYNTTSNLLTLTQGYVANFGSSTAATTADMTDVVNNHTLSVTLYNHNQPYTLWFNPGTYGMQGFFVKKVFINK